MAHPELQETTELAGIQGTVVRFHVNELVIGKEGHLNHTATYRIVEDICVLDSSGCPAVWLSVWHVM